MKITAETLREHLLEFAQKNAPVRKINDKNPKRPAQAGRGKKGHEYVFSRTRQSQG